MLKKQTPCTIIPWILLLVFISSFNRYAKPFPCRDGKKKHPIYICICSLFSLVEQLDHHTRCNFILFIFYTCVSFLFFFFLREWRWVLFLIQVSQLPHENQRPTHIPLGSNLWHWVAAVIWRKWWETHCESTQSISPVLPWQRSEKSYPATTSTPRSEGR